MSRHLFRFVNNLQIRWKLLVVVLPLVLVPLFVVGGVVGWIAYRQAHLGITQASMADLDHLARFTVDLLDAHHRQFEVYREDKKKTVHKELATLTELAYGLVEAQYRQQRAGRIDQAAAQEIARRTLKRVQVGETGYIYAMTTHGDLKVHIAREGENVFDQRDEDGHYFIRAMCQAAKTAAPETMLTIIYPWRNPELEAKPRPKMVTYRYFAPWDWIIASGGYLDETYEDPAAERQAFASLKERLKAKKVGDTGYIYCMDSNGTLTIHPEAEGQNIFDARD